MSELRQSMMVDTDMLASKRRFGLFSQPPSTAIGDDSPFKQKLARRGQDGKPITLPRNMLAGPNRSGVGRSSFIESTSSIYVGDKYTDPHKIQQKYYKQHHSKPSFQERDFLPSSAPSSIAQYPYKHVDQNPLPKIPPKRDESGRVMTIERNFTTNPMVKVDREVFKEYRHMLDPFQRQAQMQSQQRKLNKQKMLPQLFRSMSHGDILFNSDKKTYGIDARTEEFLKKKHSFQGSQPIMAIHENGFKPVRRGHGDPIGKFPEFIMPNPQQLQLMQKSKEKYMPKRGEGEQRQEWKHNGNKRLSRPTPSISYSSMNLRKYF